MSSVQSLGDRCRALSLGLLLGGPLAAQPLCDVLLRPAFNYSTDGLSLILSDSSTTFGTGATGLWTYGDGTGATSTAEHVFPEPGTYEVCLTLTATTLPCSSTYCRQVTVPLTDCGGAVDAFFHWNANGTNTAAFEDASLVAFTGERFWEFGDGSSSTEYAPEHTWQLPGPHFVTLTRTQEDCSATFGAWVEVDGNASTCGPGLFVDFTVDPSGGETLFEPSIVVNNVLPVVSVWSYGDGDIDTTTTGAHAYASPGTYQTCLLVGALVPPDLDSCFSLVCHTTEQLPEVSIVEHSSNSLRVWPNPFATTLHASVDTPPMIGVIRLLDPLGRTVREQTGLDGVHATLHADGLPDGLYFLEVDVVGERLRLPVIKGSE